MSAQALVFQKLPVMNADAFVAWSLAQEGRWELIDGWPVRAQSESTAHRRVKSGILRALEDRLPPGAPCSPEGDGALVRIDDVNSLSPDAAVNNCAPLDMNSSLLTRPTVIFEVAISSRQRDLGEKRLSYFRNPDVAHYIVVTPEDRLTFHWRRGDAKPAVIPEGGALVLAPEPTLSMTTDVFFTRLQP